MRRLSPLALAPLLTSASLGAPATVSTAPGQASPADDYVGPYFDAASFPRRKGDTGLVR